MANILCIETATTNCSVALTTGDGVLAVKEDYNNKYSHAEKLHVFIKEILEENDLKLEDLDAVAISKGPGSYTGLRIGVSAAKGLCFSLDVPLIAVETLDSLARQVKENKDFIIPMLDARRMEVYSAIFDGNYKKVRETKAEVLDTQSYMEYLEKGTVCFIGTGVKKFKKICEDPNAIYMEDRLPSARELCAIAQEKFEKKLLEDVAYFEPYYLKDFIGG